MTLSPADIELCAFVDECARSMRVKAEEKGVTLAVAPCQAQIQVTADEMAMRQIVLNLLSNAVKFTDKGRVEVLVARDGRFVEIAVSDTGCGIAEEHLKRIFQPFEQVDNSLARHHGGTGLGLPIIAKLAAAHGGTCTVESRLGQGSRFGVRLPIAKEALIEAA
jgi:signal transduction histidine kinase